jgi:hypothetical protein
MRREHHWGFEPLIDNADHPALAVIPFGLSAVGPDGSLILDDDLEYTLGSGLH